ncbi:MAG: hypothetical protein JWO68_3641, partial [Actinomycetia bacterium]|nr:hypothetical protein [Actinomycetes bacterium]
DDGCVRFEADVRLLRPAGHDGNRKLLFVVANRGFLGGVPFSAGAPLQFGSAGPLLPGDGFLLQRGWTIAWCGWQWDVLRQPGVVGLTAPEAAVEPGWTRIEWRPDAAHADHALSDSNFLFTFADHPTVSVDDEQAMLTSRTAPDGERTVLPRSSWRFTDDTHVALDGDFQPFHWYELVYRTNRAPVVGTGLLAVRDLVSHLRTGPIDHALGYGVSQSGRFLRQLLWEGLNLDEAGEVVFDGVLAHIAGGRRGEFNQRYAQPSLTHVIGWSNLPPFDTAGLLERQRALGGVPKTMLVNTAWEYWRGDGALVHVHPETGGDLPEDPDARAYLVAGTDHIGAMPMKDSMPTANPVHHLDLSPVLRALFVELDQWACDGVEPPPSQVPRWNDGTASWRTDVLERFGSVPTPDPAVLNVTRTVDLGPDAERGIGRWPLRLGAPMAPVVADVDEDGNEVAGIRLPAIAAPVAVFTGWNPRRHVEGLPDVLYEFVGSRLPFPPGRPTLAERYRDRDGYAVSARRAAESLVAGRFLLEGDVDRAVEDALRLYDESE